MCGGMPSLKYVLLVLIFTHLSSCGSWWGTAMCISIPSPPPPGICGQLYMLICSLCYEKGIDAIEQQQLRFFYKILILFL